MQALQTWWEQDQTAKALAKALSAIYKELRYGRFGNRLPDQRLKYGTGPVQLRMQWELEFGGRNIEAQSTSAYIHNRLQSAFERVIGYKSFCLP